MRLFIGLKVSLEKTAICVISEHGKTVKAAQVASEPEALLRWINDQGGASAAVGLEAGALSQWLHRRLSKAGQPVVVMKTRQEKGALKAQPIKTDRRDALIWQASRHSRPRPGLPTGDQTAPCSGVTDPARSCIAAVCRPCPGAGAAWRWSLSCGV